MDLSSPEKGSTQQTHSHLICIYILFSLEYLNEVLQLWLGEGVPLYCAVRIVPQNQLAVAMSTASLQDDLERIVLFK